MPKTRPDPLAPAPAGDDTLAAAIAVSLAGPASTAPGAPPPHLLWSTLETAYAPPEQNPEVLLEERWPPYVALPFAIGLSLTLWAIIIAPVLLR